MKGHSHTIVTLSDLVIRGPRGNPAKPLRSKEESGAEGQNRTADTMIFSHVLYRLSYLGIYVCN